MKTGQMNMGTQTIKIFNILKSKFSETEAEEIVNYFECLPAQGLATKQDVQAVQNDVLAMKVDMSKLEVRLIKWVLGTGVGVVLAIAGMIKLMVK